MESLEEATNSAENRQGGEGERLNNKQIRGLGEQAGEINGSGGLTRE